MRASWSVNRGHYARDGYLLTLLFTIRIGGEGYLSGSDFGSGHDLRVHGFEPCISSVLTARILEPASDSVSPSLSAPPPTRAHALSFSQKQTDKHFF